MNIHNSRSPKFTLTLAIVAFCSVIFSCHNVVATEVRTDVETGSDLNVEAGTDLNVEAGTDLNAEAGFVLTEQAVLDLIKVLDAETELATRTKMNVDFVPGMVSVLHGKDMLARGMRTVYEALALIPGIELSKTQDGQLQVIVRGVGKTFSSGKVKILLNGIPSNATLNAFAVPLTLPLELVSRIEVIRGPGSVIYGEYASVGVINILTWSEGNQGFIRRGDLKDRFVGGHVSAVKLNKNLSINVSFSDQRNKGGTVDAGKDILASADQSSNSPGPINNAEHNRSLLVAMDYRGYDILWQYVERGFGDHFGIANALPSYSDRIIRTTRMQNLQAARPWTIRRDLNARAKLGWIEHVVDSEQQEIFPAGFPGMGGDVFTEGVLGAPHYKEDKFYGGVEVDYQGLEDHDFLFGLEYAYIKQGETYSVRNYEVVNTRLNLIPNKRYSGERNWLATGAERRVLGVYIQDQYAPTEKWNLTGGLRLDDYDDVGSHLSPRLAAVYHVSDINTLKFQYAESFRPPTFLEMNTQNNPIVSGNPHLEAEHLNSYEAGYVYNNGITVGRITVFYYTLENLISIDADQQLYVNSGEVEARGMELEYQQSVTHFAKMNLTLSHTNAEINGAQIYGVARTTGNMGLILQPMADTTIVAQYRFVGDRQRGQDDSRESLDGYETVDIIASVSNVFYKGFSVRAAIKNLFDEEVKYPSGMVARPPGGGSRPGYEDDYPEAGRQISLQMLYEF